MRRIENIVLYLVVGLIVIASFKIPEILVEIENNHIQKKVYEQEKSTSSIDVEAQKIYLVKAIHSTEEGNYMLTLSSNQSRKGKSFRVEVANEDTTTKHEIENEILKLKEWHILENYENNPVDEIQIGIVNKVYENNNNQYKINSLYLKLGEKEYQVEREDKTGKILVGAYPKEVFSTCISKEEIMRNYIQYLDLYIIDDWKYEDNMLKSEKAKLVVNLVDVGEVSILSIHTTNRIANAIEMVQSVPN